MIPTRPAGPHLRMVALFASVFLLGVMATPVAGAVLDKLDCTGCVDTDDIHHNAVKSTKIKKGAVHTGDVRNAAVTRQKLADGAVTIEKLALPTLMSARVDSDGTLIVGSPGVISARAAKGHYVVIAPIDVTSCVVTVSQLVAATQSGMA